MTVQHPTPQAVPVVVDEATRLIAAAPSLEPTLSHAEIGQLRYSLLDTRGLADSAAVRSGAHDRELQDVIPELAEGALQLARATLDRLAMDASTTEPPVVLHTDISDVPRLVGQTMFWADHYVAHDGLAATSAARRDDPVSWRGAVADLLEARPLVEAGIFVPVFTDLAIALVDEAVDAMVAVDLADPSYVAWAEQQIVIEGPTAREAAFVHVVDDYPHDG
ncbi:MAG TPA: hypothetical protein VNG13_10140 [Mycobacteriales bacterium]|nr:hypothetical protein [Mycobacteriales bacterium]